VEDMRIDAKACGLLPNVSYFFERLVNDHVIQKAKTERWTKMHLINRCLATECVRRISGTVVDESAVQTLRDKNIPFTIDEIHDELNYNAPNPEALKIVKDKIIAIRDAFGIPEEQDQPPEEQECAGGGDKPGNIEALMEPSGGWGDGSPIEGLGNEIVGEAALEEQTKEEFKRLLEIKSRHKIQAGTTLDTDNLTAFFTGDLEPLFKDEEIQRKRRSKVWFLLDASGSMHSMMPAVTEAREWAKDTVVKAVRSILSILQELKETEGVNIDWEVWGFSTDAWKFKTQQWEKEYTAHGGGTSIQRAFDRLIYFVEKDTEIDGNKLIIFLTDGEVGGWEIEEVEKMIIRNSSIARVMIIGVNARTGTTGAFITDKNNIMVCESADSVLMDTIKMMVE
jgi:hypothetical protein